MHHGRRQIIAEKVSSTVRSLDLLGLDYSVSAPKKTRKKGNRSPRVITIESGIDSGLRIYNGIEGHTWANEATGRPVPGIGNIEDLYAYLRRRQQKRNKSTKVVSRKA
jgi:hypothetical protein